MYIWHETEEGRVENCQEMVYDIAVLRQTHTLLVVMRDTASENKSQEVIDSFESMGVKNYYSTSHEQWRNGLPEAAINSVMNLSWCCQKQSWLDRGWAIDSGSNLLRQAVRSGMSPTKQGSELLH